MRLPNQAPCVDRDLMQQASVRGTVAASDTIDDIFRVANGVTGTLGNLAGLAGPLLGGMI